MVFADFAETGSSVDAQNRATPVSTILDFDSWSGYAQRQHNDNNQEVYLITSWLNVYLNILLVQSLVKYSLDYSVGLNITVKV